jgi:hypothetical protein
MQAYHDNDSKHGTKTRHQLVAENLKDNSPELHIGIDEVLAMRVGCWRPPVYLGTGPRETIERTAHRTNVRLVSPRFEPHREPKACSVQGAA